MSSSATGLPGKIYLYTSPFITVALWLVLCVRLPFGQLEHVQVTYLTVQVVLFLLLTIGAGLSPVKLPRGGAMTVAFALDYAGILIFGPVIAAGIAAASTPVVLRKTAPFRVFWNAGQVMLSVLAAGYAYSWAGGQFVFSQTTLTDTHEMNFFNIGALVLGGLVYVAVNTLAVAGAISVATGRPVLGTWMVSFRWMFGRFLAVAPFGVLMAIVFSLSKTGSQDSIDLEGLFTKIAAVALFFVPLILARWAFKSSMEMLDVYNQTIHALSNALEAYDPYTRNHSERVTQISEKIARHMRLPEPKIEALLAASRLHDMGKCHYDWENIIRKPGRPTEEEWQIIRSHPLEGAQIAEEIQVAFLPSTADIVRAHHERVDGSGYPRGLKGDEIDLAARILCVADSFEAITSRRSYQAQRSDEEGIAELRRHAGTQFDAQVVEALAAVLTAEKVADENAAALQAPTDPQAVTS